jgi:hypothetical protein
MQFHDGATFSEHIPSVTQGNGMLYLEDERNYEQVSILLFTCRSTQRLSPLVLCHTVACLLTSECAMITCLEKPAPLPLKQSPQGEKPAYDIT